MCANDEYNLKSTTDAGSTSSQVTHESKFKNKYDRINDEVHKKQMIPLS